MKKVSLFSVLSFVCAFTLAASPLAEGLTAGTYEATVDSVGGPLTVAVTVSDAAIEAVEVKEIYDTEGIYQPVVERLPAMMVENQSINVDSVAGATLSSMFFKNAVKEALSQATEDLSSFQEKVAYAAPAQEDMETDVVIVGAGISGLSAALTVSSLGHQVVLLEQLAYVGGNCIPSDQYSVNSGEVWDQILEDFNAEGMNVKYEDFWGGVMQRMLPAGESDTSYMNEICHELRAAAESKGAIVLTETPATGLVIEDGVVCGVTAEPIGQDAFTIRAKATLLTLGGFQGNKEMVSEYLPYADGAMTIGPSKGLGQAYDWLKDFDIATRDMDFELAMFYSINPSTGHHAVWGVYPINFIDKEGALIHEDHDYNSGSMKAYEAMGSDTFYTLFTQKDVDESGEDPAILEEFLRSKSLQQYDSMSALLEAYPLASLQETLEGLGYTEEDVFFIATARAGIYGTMGGIAVDDDFRVLLNDGSVIPGLFAAGETIGRNYGGAIGVGTQSGYDAAHGVDRVLKGE